MAVPRPLALAALVALCALAAAPAAEAHASYITPDGKYRLVIGSLNEPVYTYVKSGFDLQITTNDAARTPVTINPGNLTATLVAPDGRLLPMQLKAQFGKPGAYTNEAYTLTMPGQYNVSLQGSILGSPIAGTFNVAGPIKAQSSILFPDASVPDAAQLRDQVNALQARVAALEGKATSDSTGQASAPGPAVALIAIALLAAALRRSA